MQDDLDAIADRLDDLAEQLTDLGISALREAIEDPDSEGRRPEIEKRIAKARRAVDKAAHMLRGGPSSTVI
ncbi:MAG: hypothetical protein ACI8Y4_004927 [Candidatus Poriferisodalaceae bacterium]|jgi:hypothetical protein